MTLLEHLDELRTRLLRSVVALGLSMLLALVFYRELVGIVTIPHFRAMEWLGRATEHSRFIAGSYGGPILAVTKLCLVVGLFLASPVAARELWAFVSAGLHPHERRWASSFAPISFLLFLLGCVSGYFVLVPWSLYGMARMMPLEQVDLVVDFGSYVSLFMTMTLLLGAVFQLPLLMAFLSRTGLVPPSLYTRYWKHAVVANVVLAAVISPADLVSLGVFAVPLVALYGAGMLAAPRAESALLPR